MRADINHELYTAIIIPEINIHIIQLVIWAKIIQVGRNESHADTIK